MMSRPSKNSKRPHPKSTLSRSLSTPSRSNSIMQVQTLDQSLQGRRRFQSETGIDKLNLSVSWSKLHIREYSRRVGDNPSVSGGPPLSLSWEYDPDELVIPLDEFEADRGPRRTSHEMAMPRAVRVELLTKEWGATSNEIASAVRENNRIKNSRRRTVNNLDSPLSRVEEKVEGFKKGFKRTIFRRKKVSEQYEDWKREAERAMAAIKDENEIAAALEDADAEAERAMATIAHENAAAAAEPSSFVVINEDDAAVQNLSEADQAASTKRDVYLSVKVVNKSVSDLKVGEKLTSEQYSGSSTAELYGRPERTCPSKFVPQSA